MLSKFVVRLLLSQTLHKSMAAAAHSTMSMIFFIGRSLSVVIILCQGCGIGCIAITTDVLS